MIIKIFAGAAVFFTLYNIATGMVKRLAGDLSGADNCSMEAAIWFVSASVLISRF